MPNSELIPYADQDPHHFLNLISDGLRERYLSLPQFLHKLDERSLILQIYNSPEPFDTDVMLRMTFWDLYEERFQSRKRITNADIFRGVCHSTTFDDVINTTRLAYILRDLPSYRAKLKVVHKIASEEIQKILTRKEEVNIKTGITDTSLPKLKADLYKYLDQRLHGGITQRIDVQQNVNQKTLQVNLDGTQRHLKGTNSGNSHPDALPPKDYSHMSNEEVQERLKFLEEERAKLLHLPVAAPPPEEIIMGQVVEESGRVSEEFQREDKRD